MGVYERLQESKPAAIEVLKAGGKGGTLSVGAGVTLAALTGVTGPIAPAVAFLVGMGYVGAVAGAAMKLMTMVGRNDKRSSEQVLATLSPREKLLVEEAAIRATRAALDEARGSAA